MKLFFLAILNVAIFLSSCSKKAPNDILKTSKATFDQHSIMIMTGGNGNGTNPTEYTRYYEIHEGNGTVDCITEGGDCKVNAYIGNPTANQTSEFNLLINAINTGTVTNFFQGTSWSILFPDLANTSILSQLANGSLYMSKAPSLDNSYCFVLSSAPNYTSKNVLKVWYWTFSQTALNAVIGNGTTYDRSDEWSEDGTKCTCVNPGNTCSAGIVSGTVQATQFALLDNYIQSDNLRNYFNNENWTVLFPDMNDVWLSSILDGNLKIMRLQDENSINYALTDISTTTLIKTKIIHTWIFQN